MWEKGKATFWAGYVRWALDDWRRAVSELREDEIRSGCREVGMPFLSASASIAAWRKHAREMEKGKRGKFWVAANTEMLEKISYGCSLTNGTWTGMSSATEKGRQGHVHPV